MNEVKANLERKGFSASSYVFVQLSSVKLCTLIKNDKRDILFYGHGKVPM